MAPTSTSTTLTTKAADGSPYQLDNSQTFKASKALLSHIKATESSRASSSDKKSLLAPSSPSDTDTLTTFLNDIPIYLNLTTKTHIIDSKRLKPAKIGPLPHPLLLSEDTTICLITADPQRTYKDLVASPAFPDELRTRITRVIGVEKLKKKYSQYEAQRQLLSEHDIFLADDRIVTRLAGLLGKTFYKSAAKRPIPINMQPPAARSDDGKRLPRAVSSANTANKKSSGANAAKAVITPQKLAAEIEKTFSTALVALSPSTLTSVRVGRAGWKAEELAENISFVAEELVKRFVPKGWKNMRALHIKGPNTAALPIWLAEELWVDEGMIVSAADEEGEQQLAIEASKTSGEGKANVGKKRKAAAVAPEEEQETTETQTKKSKKAKQLPEGDDKALDAEIERGRKARLQKQKEAAEKEIGDAVTVPGGAGKKAGKKEMGKRKASAVAA